MSPSITSYPSPRAGGFERMAGLGNPVRGHLASSKGPGRVARPVPPQLQPTPARITGPRLVEKGGAS